MKTLVKLELTEDDIMIDLSSIMDEASLTIMKGKYNYEFLAKIIDYTNSKSIEKEYIPVDIIDDKVVINYYQLIDKIVINDVIHIKNVKPKSFKYKYISESIFLVKYIDDEQLILEPYETIFMAFRERKQINKKQ